MDDSTPQSIPSHWQQVWIILAKAVDTGDSAFSTPCVSTVADRETARSRVVVLRDCNAQDASLTFYTDARSIKLQHLRGGSNLTWCFWDPESQLQLIGGGPTNDVDASVRRKIWDDLPKHGRKAYATLHAPGTTLPDKGTDLPADWHSRELSATEYAFANFAVLRTRLLWAEVLHLDRSGNTRTAAKRTREGDWAFERLVP